MPLFKVDFPPVTMILVEQLVKVATFDLPKVNVPDIFGEDVFPEMD
jgi:hypothetical protein